MNLLIELQRAEALKPHPPDKELGFGRYFTDHMFQMDYTPGQQWHNARITPYGPLALDPAAAVLHYGQSVFDGAKAFRARDGRVRLFRMDEHSRRLNQSAVRLCLPAVPPEMMIQAMKELVRIEREWVPSSPGTALYLRPTIIATEAFLGVRPAERFKFFIILSPVGNYYADSPTAVKIWVEDRYIRAAPGGLGAAKTGANYAASLLAATEAKKRGFSQVLWLDAIEHRYIEEVGTMNLFVRIGDEVITPPLSDSFLGGVTRSSLLTVLRDWGMKAVERKVSVEELKAAHSRGQLLEVFGSGTGAIISPVSELGFKDGSLVIGNGKVGELSTRLREALLGIQHGILPDKHGWLTPID